MPYYDNQFYMDVVRGECYRFWWPLLVQTQHGVQGAQLEWKY